MNRHVLTIDLRDEPGVTEAYRRYHADVWPEVARSLTEAGVVAMDIHLLGRRLVMILDLEDGLTFDQVFARHALAGAKVAEWERLMKALQQPAPGARDGEWWAAMDHVCRLRRSTTTAADSLSAV